MPGKKPGKKTVLVFGGVDTHADTHHAAVVDGVGRVLGDRGFPVSDAGYRLLVAWLRSFGQVVEVGIEGTGSYGAGLNRHLQADGVRTIEVNRPDRQERRRHGKSDQLDAVAAARAVQSGKATAAPKTRIGPVEAIRVLQVTRRGAVKARTAALNHLYSTIITAPQELRAALQDLSPAGKLASCRDLAVDEDNLTDPVQATAAALRATARRVQALNDEIALADTRLRALLTTTAPRLMNLFGVGPDSAGQLLITAGDNPDRLHSEAALAHLAGVAPIPASSGRTDRHRLNRGGDRQANRAIYTIALSRLRHDPRTKTYVQKRTTQGLTKKEIIRCLKRYIVREIYTTLIADYLALTP